MDYYQILGVSFSDNSRTIKQHYYKLAKQYHPDKFSGDPIKCEQFKHLSEAYSTLSNPKKRYLYDIQRVADFFDVSLNLQLTDDELELLYTYYQDICQSKCRSYTTRYNISSKEMICLISNILKHISHNI